MKGFAQQVPPVRNKYLIITTRPDATKNSGRYMVAIDNIISFIPGSYMSFLYANGMVVRLNFANETGSSTVLKSGNDNIVSYFTDTITRLLNSTDSTFKVPYKIPAAVDALGEQMYVNTITFCQFTTAC